MISLILFNFVHDFIKKNKKRKENDSSRSLALSNRLKIVLTTTFKTYFQFQHIKKTIKTKTLSPIIYP